MNPNPTSQNHKPGYPSSGFILLDKPAGLTSAACVGKIKRILAVKKIGHTGTLDKFATGLLILPYGRATSFADTFLKQDKSYEFSVCFGVSTDSGDPQGEVLETMSEQELAQQFANRRNEIEKSILAIRDWSSQYPPKISALKIAGKRQSDLFRQGVEFESKPRPIRIEQFELMELNEYGFRAHVHVSSGTYIRKLAIDLAEILNIPMHVSELRRTSIGRFSLEKADTMEQIVAGDIHILTIMEAVDVPKVQVAEQEISKVYTGQKIAISIPEQKFLLVAEKSQKILAWCEPLHRKESFSYRYIRVFSEVQ